jgi:hypothetical protein
MAVLLTLGEHNEKGQGEGEQSSANGCSDYAANEGSSAEFVS